MITLRTINPSFLTKGGGLDIHTRNPSWDLVKSSIEEPYLLYGQGMYYDVRLWSADNGNETNLSFFLGLPFAALVVYCDSSYTKFVRTSDASENHFVVIPDRSPDAYFNVPHSYFVTREQAVESAKIFLTSDGARFTTLESNRQFDLDWIEEWDREEDDPFTAAVARTPKPTDLTNRVT